MTTGNFESFIPDLKGTLKAEVVDTAPGIAPHEVIKANKPFEVKVHLEFEGGAINYVAGTLELKLHFQEQGGAGSHIGPVEVPLVFGQSVYDHVFTVPGLPATTGGSIYGILVSVSYLDPLGNAGLLGGGVDCGLYSILP